MNWRERILGYAEAIKHIQVNYGYDEDRATRCVEIAISIGRNWPSSCPVDDGFFIVRYHGTKGKGFLSRQFTIEPPLSHQKVAAGLQTAYTPKRNIQSRPTRGELMPPRGRTKQVDAEPEVEETDEARDYTIYAEKDVTPTMQDFAEWIVAEVYDGNQKAFDAEDPVRIVSLAGTLRMEFQRSELNKTRRAERQAARASAATETDEAEEDEAPATPARSTRGKATATKGATKAPAGKATTAKPTGRRGRQPASAEAPY